MVKRLQRAIQSRKIIKHSSQTSASIFKLGQKEHRHTIACVRLQRVLKMLKRLQRAIQSRKNN